MLCFGGSLLYAQGDDLGEVLNRGRVLAKAGKYEQALPYFLLALERSEALYGPDGYEIVPILDALADLYADHENHNDAEPLYERALAIRERELARFQAGIARTLNRLASIYEATGRAVEAEELYRRVLSASEPALGEAHPSVQAARRRLDRILAARASARGQ